MPGTFEKQMQVLSPTEDKPKQINSINNMKQ